MAIGTTIDGLNAVTSLTAQDEVPVWDKEASGEPTKKITAQNMTASVKTLGGLVNASEMNNALAGKQNTLTFDSTPTTGSTNPVTSGGVADAIAQSTANRINDASAVVPSSAVNTLTPTNGCSSYSNWGGCYYYKVGTRVTVHIGVQGLTANQYVSNIGVVLPTGYRPKNDTNTLGSSGTSEGYSNVSFFKSGIIAIVSTGNYALAEISFDAFG